MSRKFNIGDKVRFIPSGDVYEIDDYTEDDYYHLKGWLTDVYVNDLRRYEGSECNDHIVEDHELVDHSADSGNMLRLQIAAQVTSGIIAGDGDYFYYYLPGSKQYLPNSISRKCPEEVARVAFIFADALIAESQKGGAE